VCVCVCVCARARAHVCVHALDLRSIKVCTDEAKIFTKK